MKKPTQKDVDECLDNAVVNGYLYEVYDMPVKELAGDLVELSSLFEDWEPKDFVSLIKDWRSRNPKP